MKLVNLFDGPMARLTFDAGLNMPVVAELDVLGEPVNLYPFDRLLLFPMFLENLDALDLVVFGRKL